MWDQHEMIMCIDRFTLVSFHLAPTTSCSDALWEQCHSAWANLPFESHGDMLWSKFGLWTNAPALWKSDWEIEFWPSSAVCFSGAVHVHALMLIWLGAWKTSQYECGLCKFEGSFLSLNLQSWIRSWPDPSLDPASTLSCWKYRQ